MPATEARIGYGSTVEMADLATPTVFTYLGEVTSITPPSESTATEDATHMASPNKTLEFIEGMTDPGEFSTEMSLVPGGATDAYLRAAKGVRKWIRITFASGVQLLFAGIRTAYSVGALTNGKMTASATFKVSGAPITTAVTAPRNLVVPTITGTAKVGFPLTLDDGIWAGTTDRTYQWKADATNISQAKGLSYVPITSQIGKVITCEVTGANGTYTLAVLTAATAAVVA